MLLPLATVTEWGLGAVVVPIVFEVDDDNEDTRFVERPLLLVLS